jgi:hypothetical protein
MKRLALVLALAFAFPSCRSATAGPTAPLGCDRLRGSPTHRRYRVTTYHVRAGDTIIVDPEPVTPPPPPPDPFTVSDAAFSAAMVAEVNKRRAAGWTGTLADGTRAPCRRSGHSSPTPTCSRRPWRA